MADGRLISGPVARVHIQSIGEDTSVSEGMKILSGPVERIHIQSIEPGVLFPTDTEAPSSIDIPLSYEDLQGNVSTAKVPAVSAPEWTTWNYGVGGGIAFHVLGFGVNEYVDFTLQTLHAMQLNSVLHSHIHWSVPTDDVGKKFKFQLDVIVGNINAAFAKPAGSPFTVEHTLVAGDAGKHHVSELADIPGVNTTVSAMYVCRLKRVAASSNEYGSDVYIMYNDSHVLKDTLGSETELVK